jgi:flagellar M-ring protein FliF
MSALLEGLRALGPARLIAMATAAVSLFALLAVLAANGGSGSGRMALLYADLDPREVGQIVEQLDTQHIAHQVSVSGDRIMVPEGEVGTARVMLARQGLPTGGSVGYEIFDRSDSLTASAFQQQIDETRALEGELDRTIRLLSGVRSARVQVVLPKREPFARQEQEAQASVLLTMAGNARMDREGVQAVLNLVAAAVPGLRPKNIAVVDSRGDLLARPGDTSSEAGAAQGFEEIKRTTETRLAQAVENMLESTLGPGRVRAEAAVDLDFARVKETQQKFDPDGQVVRSSQSTTDNSKSTDAAPSVSVQNNLPNANAGTPTGAGSQDQKQEDTTNYEIGNTVHTLVRDQPEIRRISLAVLVDGQTTVDASGKSEWKPRTQEELDHIAALVRSAIGYDEKRGDKVEVVNMRFVTEAMTPEAPHRKLLGIDISSPDMMRLAQTALFGLVGLLGLLFVLRPMVLRLTAVPAGAAALAAGGAAAGALPAAAAAGLLALPRPDGTGQGAPTSAGAARLAAREADEAMIDLANIEGQIRASSIRRISEMVEQNPEECLAIVRSWLQKEPA